MSTFLLNCCVSSSALSQAASAQIISRSNNEITVTGMQGIGIRTWNSRCKSKTYQYSARISGDGALQNVAYRPT